MFQTIKTFDAKKHIVKFIIFFSISIITSNTVAMFKCPLKSSYFRTVQCKEIKQQENMETKQREYSAILTRFKKCESTLETIRIQITLQDSETLQNKIEQIKKQDLLPDIKLEKLKILFASGHMQYLQKFLEMARSGLLRYNEIFSKSTKLTNEFNQLKRKISQVKRQIRLLKKIEKEKEVEITKEEKKDLDILLTKSAFIEQQIQRHMILLDQYLKVAGEAIQQIDGIYGNIQKLLSS